jgi:hypothetical protein
MTTTSGLTSGPFGPRAIPGAVSIMCTCSSVTDPTISVFDPARIISALEGDPDETSVALNPRAIAIAESYGAVWRADLR